MAGERVRTVVNCSMYRFIDIDYCVPPLDRDTVEFIVGYCNERRSIDFERSDFNEEVSLSNEVRNLC